MSLKIKQFKNRKGNPVANHFTLLIDGEIEVLQSYESYVALVILSDKKVLLDEETWDYSTTTTKYLNMFLDRHGFSNKRKDKEQYTKINIEEYL